MKHFLFSFAAFIICAAAGNAQSFSPAAGLSGSTAVHKDDSRIISWADSVQITRGSTDIRQNEFVPASYGEARDALGKADGKVVSMGDGGEALLYFSEPITNGEGADFLIFENGLRQDSTAYEAFLELAFTEVSSDGVNFFRFPAICELPPDDPVTTYETTDARYIHNLAGKYSLNYGTPFDLEELAHFAPKLNINAVRFIKIIDVTGSADAAFATYDSMGNIVLDPFPTPFASGGFDLDAAGVIHQQTVRQTGDDLIFVNPVGEQVFFPSGLPENSIIEICSIQGVIMMTVNSDDIQSSLSVNELHKGMYLIRLIKDGNRFTKKFIKL